MCCLPAGSILLQGLFFTGNSIDWGQAFLGMVGPAAETPRETRQLSFLAPSQTHIPAHASLSLGAGPHDAGGLLAAPAAALPNVVGCHPACTAGSRHPRPHATHSLTAGFRISLAGHSDPLPCLQGRHAARQLAVLPAGAAARERRRLLRGGGGALRRHRGGVLFSRLYRGGAAAGPARLGAQICEWRCLASSLVALGKGPKAGRLPDKPCKAVPASSCLCFQSHERLFLLATAGCRVAVAAWRCKAGCGGRPSGKRLFSLDGCLLRCHERPRQRNLLAL